MLIKKPSIVYAIDENFVPHFTASLTSLLENNIGVFENYFVATENIDSKDLSRAVKFFKEKYNIKLDILNTNNLGLKTSSLSTKLPVSPATYYRLFLGEILPSEVEKVLYLDADTIILEDLTKLVNKNFNKNCILAVAESRFVLNSAPQSLVSENLIGNEYFNAGVMYIDIANWKTESISNELINTGMLHKNHIRYWDQDILNIYFKNRIGEIDSGYNVFRSQRRLNPPPKIVHFAGPVKPWHLFNSHPYRKEYRYFRDLTPFSFKYVGGAAPKAILIQFLGQFGVGRGALRVKRYFNHEKQS